MSRPVVFAIAVTCLLTFTVAPIAQALIKPACDTSKLKSIALDVLKSDITDCPLQEGGKCLVAGEFWNQLWVRDTSYSSLMGLYSLFPDELKNTFRELVLMNGEKGYPKQDSAADFGSFPYQTDSIVWVVGAFELAKRTDDADFRQYVYEVGKKMYPVWEKTTDPKDGLIYGAPSFLDSWASFPEDWQGHREKFLKNKFLSTNVLWLRFEQIMIWEGLRYKDLETMTFYKELADWENRVRILNNDFYLPSKGYYAYYLGSDAYEALGNGLIRKFGFDFQKIDDVRTFENFFPAHYPMYGFKIPGNWYSETSQHVWVDSFLAAITHEPVRDFCGRYEYLINTNNDIAELISNGVMFGGKRQLWSATGVYFYLDAANRDYLVLK
jgi:hypothetical protein